MSALRWSIALVLATLGPAASPGGPATQEGPTLHDLAFMAGCWEGEFSARGGATGTIEEHYTSPSDNVVLGTTRYLVDERAVQFELTVIRADSAGVTLLPYPGGTPSEHGFRLTRVEAGASGQAAEAVFEAPEHDFPKRIVYRSAPGRLVARIDDGEGGGRVREWTMAAVACGGP